jgi:hypothetical protein
MKYNFDFITLFMLLALIPTGVKAQSNSVSAADNDNYNRMVQQSLGGMSLQNIPPPTSDISIQFPNSDPAQPPSTATIKKGSSWANLPIGAAMGMGSGGQPGTQQTNPASYATIAAKVFKTTPSQTAAMQASLNTFPFLNSVPVKVLITAFPQLGKVQLTPSQTATWTGCGNGTTLADFAASSCGTKPMPTAVQQAIPIQQTGIQNIPYATLATKLNINNLPASDFPLLQNLPLSEIIAPNTNLNIGGNNLFKVDYLDTLLAGQDGKPIKGINSISGSNRVPNATCKDQTCDYAVLRSYLQGTSADVANPYNHALAFQINSPGTTWLDGGIGAIGTTIWNFKEPPGVSPPFNSDYMKIVLDNANPRTGTVQQEAYLAFCMNIAFEWNCSSKFIGPITIPWQQVSEANKAMLTPLAVTLPTAAVASSPVQTTPNAITPASTTPATPTNQGTTALSATPPQPNLSSPSSDATYANLFGTNTLGACSPAQNMCNSSTSSTGG